MRVVLVGTGYWGSKLRRVLSELGHDIVAEIVKNGETEILEVDADAAVIATPPETHCAIALAAMSIGMDVLVEKPMATSHRDSLRMEQFARENGLVLAVDHTYLHTASFEYLTNIDEPLVGYSSLRIAPPQTNPTVSAGWDLVVHDLAILNGLDAIGLQGSGIQDWDAAQAQVNLVGGGLACITTSRKWVEKERTVVLSFPSRSFLWKDDSLHEFPTSKTVVRETRETLKNVIDDFEIRCNNRDIRGLNDGAFGASVCSHLEWLFPN